MAKRHEEMARSWLNWAMPTESAFWVQIRKHLEPMLAPLLARVEREALLKAIDAADDERDPNDSHWNKCVDNIKARIRALLEDS